jgi:ornithine lipid ester-linked acyl 2-hydroxylase
MICSECDNCKKVKAINKLIRKSMFLKNNKVFNNLLKQYKSILTKDTITLVKFYLVCHKEKQIRINANKDRSFPLFILTEASKTNFKKNYPIIKKEVENVLKKIKPSERLGQKLILTGGKKSRNLFINFEKTVNLKFLSNTFNLINKMVKESNEDYELVSLNVSIMQPRTHIRWHVGFSYYSEHVTRYMYGIDIPDFCSVNTLDEVKEIKQNDFIFFQDINNHEAWNFSDKYRTVVIFDITHKNNIPILKNTMTKFQDMKGEKYNDVFKNFNANLGQQIYNNLH